MLTNNPSVPIDIDLTRSTSGVWLVKMPKYLSQILDEQSGGAINGDVGRLIKPPVRVTKGSTAAAGRPQDVVFRLNDQVMERLKQQNPSKDYQLPPQEHRFCLSNVSDGILQTVYTRTLSNPNVPSSEQISLVGRVIQRAEVRPVENERYMSMKRKQIEVFQKPALMHLNVIMKQIKRKQNRKN
jgi:transcription initiation factor TFIIF subunit beta